MPHVYIMDKDHPGVNAQLDASTGAIETIEYEHHEIHSGSHYHVQSSIGLPAINDVLDFTWQMPDTTKWIHWTWELDTEKGVAWYIYEGVIANNPLSEPVTILNSNRNSAKTSATVMKYELQADLATANVDTDVTSAILVANGASGAGQKAGASERHHEMVMKQGSLYCLRAVAGAAGYINFDMHWYEHTDKS